VKPALPAHALGQAAESTVVALAMAGDAPAFSELVRRLQAPIRNLLRHLSLDASLADDLAQQVFLTAWRSLSKLQTTPGSPIAT
jgi:RNA polymerase sigma-70 factor (ECF subfamily)